MRKEKRFSNKHIGLHLYTSIFTESLRNAQRDTRNKNTLCRNELARKIRENYFTCRKILNYIYYKQVIGTRILLINKSTFTFVRLAKKNFVA